MLRDTSWHSTFSKSKNFAWYFLIVWTAFQVCVVYLQDILGPRFFLPSWVFPRPYDYTRVIPASLFSTRTGLVSTNQRDDNDDDNDVSPERTRLIDTEVDENMSVVPIMDSESGSLIECAVCFYGVEPTRGAYMVSDYLLFISSILFVWLRYQGIITI